MCCCVWSLSGQCQETHPVALAQGKTASTCPRRGDWNPAFLLSDMESHLVHEHLLSSSCVQAESRAGESKGGGRPAPRLPLSGQESAELDHLMLPHPGGQEASCRAWHWVEMEDKRDTAARRSREERALHVRFCGSSNHEEKGRV